MPYYGAKSKAKLATCHLDIVEVCIRAIAGGPDHTIIWGGRSAAVQADLVTDGFSQRLDSLHVIGEGRELSDAIDLAPWPVVWPNRETQSRSDFEDAIKRFHVLAGYVLGIAEALGVALLWGGDWNMNWVYTDQRFDDLGHFERVLRG